MCIYTYTVQIYIVNLNLKCTISINLGLVREMLVYRLKNTLFRQYLSTSSDCTPKQILFSVFIQLT